MRPSVAALEAWGSKLAGSAALPMSSVPSLALTTVALSRLLHPVRLAMTNAKMELKHLVQNVGELGMPNGRGRTGTTGAQLTLHVRKVGLTSYLHLPEEISTWRRSALPQRQALHHRGAIA